MIETFRPLPRIRFAEPTGHPTPEGHITSGELLEHLLPIWWCKLYCDLDTSPFYGRKFGHGSRLGEAATTGQIHECVHVIRDAGEDEALNGVIPRGSEGPESSVFYRITPGEWRSADLEEWNNDLYTGQISRHHTSPMAWANDKPIVFRRDEAETWLRRLASPHILRNPPVADAAALPDRDYVFLSEAVTWLAYGEALDSDALFKRDLSDCARVGHYDDNPQRAEPNSDFSQWLAGWLAGYERRNAARRAVQGAMARGELEGHGRCQLPSGSSTLERVPTDVFLLSVDLKLEFDGIGIVARGENRDTKEFLNGANWEDIRFARYDLERLWGSARDNAEPLIDEEFEAQRPKGAPRKMDTVVAEFDALFPNGKPLDLTWQRIAKRVSERLSERVSEKFKWAADGENLRKAVANRK